MERGSTSSSTEGRLDEEGVLLSESSPEVKSGEYCANMGEGDGGRMGDEGIEMKLSPTRRVASGTRGVVFERGRGEARGLYAGWDTRSAGPCHRLVFRRGSPTWPLSCPARLRSAPLAPASGLSHPVTLHSAVQVRVPQRRESISPPRRAFRASTALLSPPPASARASTRTPAPSAAFCLASRQLTPPRTRERAWVPCEFPAPARRPRAN